MQKPGRFICPAFLICKKPLGQGLALMNRKKGVLKVLLVKTG